MGTEDSSNASSEEQQMKEDTMMNTNDTDEVADLDEHQEEHHVPSDAMKDDTAVDANETNEVADLDERHKEYHMSSGTMNDSSNIHPGLFGWRQRKVQSSSANNENRGDAFAGPPRLDDIQVDEEYGDQSEGLLDGTHSGNAADEGNDDKEEKHAAASSIVVPTKILAMVILLFLLITHSLLGRECVVASKSLTSTIESGGITSRAITYWRAIPGQGLTVRSSYHTTSKIVAKFSADETKDMRLEVYGKPHDNEGTTRVHIVSPVNGWGTEKSSGGKDFMEPVPEKELFSDAYLDEDLEGEDGLVSLSKLLHTHYCPIFDAGYSTSSLSRYQYAPTALVVAQQFWNASQVLYLFLLISLFGVMTSPSYTESTSTQRASQLVSEKTGKTILWVFYLLFTILTVPLLPFSVYFISPGGHVSACIMTIISLATVYFSPSNVRFQLADLPPQCCTPRQHPGSLMQPSGNPDSSANTFAGTNANDVVVVRGRGLCKVESIAFLCFLGSAMYNYSTAGGHVFPDWNKIFHGIDKWLDLPGRDADVNHEVLGRFIYNMGVSKYHFPLFMPLSFGSKTGSVMFTVIWSILPFINVFYFATMYVMANRAPAVKAQRFFALFGIFHFLFLTDIISYKYGRGIRNEMSEYFHWAERFAFRFAIILPIYQNVFSGHYKQPQRNKYIGPCLHYFMATWGIIFFTYQLLMNDLLHFPQWVMGRNQTHLFGLAYSFKIGYLGTLSVMFFVNGFMMLGGTWCHHVYVGPEETGNKKLRIWKTPAAVALRNLVTLNPAEESYA